MTFVPTDACAPSAQSSAAPKFGAQPATNDARALEAIARDYIEAGFALVPIPSGSKGPRMFGWNKRENAWTKPEHVPVGYTGNIGLAHAYCSPPTCALDVDNYATAREALVARGVDLDALLAADDAVQVRSGRANRAKLLYRLGEFAEPFESINRQDLGFEMRCSATGGTTVQDVLPPSIHPETGKPYVFGGAGDPLALPEIPDDLLRLLGALRGERSANGTASAPARVLPFAEPEISPEVVAELRSALAHLRSDDRKLWVDVGHDLYELGEVGRGLWVSWSQTSEAWTPKDAVTWGTFKASHSGYRNVFARAQAFGWANPRSRAASLPHEGLPITTVPLSPPAPSLRRVEIGPLNDATVEPPRFAVRTLIPRGVVTLLGGHGGVGKSTLAVAIGAHFAAADAMGYLVRGWAGFEMQSSGKVLFVSLEDNGELVRYRLRNIAGAYGLDVGLIESNFIILDGTEGNASLATERNHAGRRSLEFTDTMLELETAAVGASLIIIDNASDAFDADENSRALVRQFYRRLTKIARDNDAGLVLLAHIDKAAARNGSNGNSYSGSTAWHNSARSRLALVQTDEGIELRHEKSNLGPTAKTLGVHFTVQGVLMPTDAPSPEDRAEGDAALLKCLADAIDKGRTISTARSGSTNTHKLARMLPGFPLEMLRASPFWLSLERLARDGKIVPEEYKNSYRKSRERWVLAPVAPVAPIQATDATPVIGANPAPVH